MKKNNLLKWGFLGLFCAFASIAGAQTTALWDWQNSLPSSITEVSLQGKTGTVESTVEGIEMYVDATNGKFKSRDNSDSSYDNDVQMNAGTILQIPVVSTSDVVTIVARSSYNYTIGGIAADSTEFTYTATEEDVEQGYAEVICTEGGAYLYSISVVQYADEESGETVTVEECLYSTEFTDWEEVSNQDVTVTTEYSNESLVFSLGESDVMPDDVSNLEKFGDYEGCIRINTDKTGDGYVTTSALNSITTVEVRYGTTGSNRGLYVYAKGDGDEDWELVLDGLQAKTGSYTETIEVNRENCELKFVSAVEDQYVFLISLNIYGNVEETVAEAGPLTMSVSPDDEDVEELTAFVVTIEGEDITLNEDLLEDIVIYSRRVTADATMSETSSEIVDGNTVFTFTLATPITDINSYEYTFPEGLFSDSNGNTNEEYVGYVYVMGAPVVHEYSADPEDGSTVETLESITIICQDGMWWSYNGEITATKDGEEYELNITDDDLVEGEDDGDNGDPSRLTINLNITEAGEYVITIPEGYFIVGDKADYSEEIVLTYTVTGGTTGIDSVTLQSTGDSKVYNLNGQRVSTPRNGIYILNGKKLLVK